MIENTLEVILNELRETKTLINNLTLKSREGLNDIDSYMNTLEASEYLDISKSHLYKLTMNRNIRFYKPNGKKIYFKKNDLDNYLNSKKSKSINDLELEANKYISKQIN